VELLGDSTNLGGLIVLILMEGGVTGNEYR